MRHRLARGLAAAGTAAALLGGCGTADQSGGPGGGPAASAGLTPVKLQLQWVTQAQFAGYFAAVDQGFYRAAGLDVKILEGGPDIVPQTVLAQRQADYAIAWVPKALASRQAGAGITEVAQVFQRSGTRQVAWSDAGIRSVADLKGKKVGNWGFGNEFELFAAMTRAGLNPGRDVTLVQQQFDMSALLKKDIDAAQAMTYNEYAQLLEARNPATGRLYQPGDFSVLNWNDTGTAMLQDAIWANTARLKDTGYRATTEKFVQASLEGWVYCRDNAVRCRDIVVKHGSTLGASHQLWQMNEVNRLIWPSPAGIGMVDKAAWDQTVKIAQSTRNAAGQTVISKEPAGEAYTNTYAQQAVTALRLDGVDVVGSTFTPVPVQLKQGGA